MKASKSLIVNIQWDRVKSRLDSATTLVEARNILTEEGVDRKRDLEELAKCCGTSVNKSDLKEQMKTHLINLIVGTRIYAETMRGIDLRMHREVLKYASEDYEGTFVDK